MTRPAGAGLPAPAGRFSLARHAGPHETWPARSRLLVDGAMTRIRIPGYTLLHQFRVDDGYLLVTDHDCPYQEATAFTLLGDDLRVLSVRQIGRMYGWFLLTRLEWLDARHLFAWSGDDDPVRITLRPWRIPPIRPRLRVQRLRPGRASAPG